jgi:hypothetical protein
MAEVLVRFTENIRGADGAQYAAQACAGVAGDGLWEGWIEFTGAGGTLRTPRETEQANREAIVYWAQGLSAAYLEGALRRAMDARALQPTSGVAAGSSTFPAPARSSGVSYAARSLSVLDPFTTYRQGEGVLRQQLMALSRDHLLSLINTYRLPVIGNEHSPKEELAEGIVQAVKAGSSVV